MALEKINRAEQECAMRSIALLLLVACAPTFHRHVFVPKDNPDAAKCWRECKAIEATCRNNPNRSGDAFIDAINAGQRRSRCEDERQDCLLSCPGAREEMVQD